MSHNPYTPPAAPVADSSAASRPRRPFHVDCAFGLMWLSVIVWILFNIWPLTGMADEVPGSVYIMVALTSVVFFSICYWLFNAVRNRKQWARTAVLVLFVLHIVVAIFKLPQALSDDLSLAITRIPQLILWIGAVVLLLTPESQNWYAKKEGEG